MPLRHARQHQAHVVAPGIGATFGRFGRTVQCRQSRDLIAGVGLGAPQVRQRFMIAGIARRRTHQPRQRLGKAVLFDENAAQIAGGSAISGIARLQGCNQSFCARQILFQERERGLC